MALKVDYPQGCVTGERGLATLSQKFLLLSMFTTSELQGGLLEGLRDSNPRKVRKRLICLTNSMLTNKQWLVHNYPSRGPWRAPLIEGRAGHQGMAGQGPTPTPIHPSQRHQRAAEGRGDKRRDSTTGDSWTETAEGHQRRMH